MKYYDFNPENINQTNDLLHNLLEGTTEYAIIATNLDDTIILWNKGAELIYGYSPNDMIGKQIPMDLLHKNDSSNNEVLFLNDDIFRTSIIDYQMNAIRKDGIIVPVSITVTKRTSKNSVCEGYLIFVKDITKRKYQEKFNDILTEITHLVNSSTDVKKMCTSIVEVISNLLEIPVVFICLFNNITNSFYIASQCGLCNNYDSHNCIYTVNESWIVKDKKTCFLTYTQLTINTETLTSHSIAKYVSSSDQSEDTSIIHIPLLSDVALIGLLHIIVPADKKSYLLSETQVLSLIANEIAAGVQRKRLEDENRQYSENLERMVVERTDELRQKDAQLVQSGKLATLGEMATGIAHEINQPLGAINLMAQGLILAKSKNKCTDEILDDKLNSIVEQIERISKIIAHLRTFARQSTDTTETIDINNPIMDVFMLIGEQLKTRNIQVKLDLKKDLPHTIADHNKLEQVFLNILGNARDALDEFETTVAEIKNLEEAPDWVKSWDKQIIIRTYQEEGHICAAISDNAFGIHKNHIQKIFEPFFTTKEVGKGTGLGLSISYGIIKDFNGTIDVDSKIMKGSTFIVKLPIAE